SRSALRSDASARWGWPAASRPGSVTSRTRVPPSSRTSSPSLASEPGPNTSRVRGGKSKDGSDQPGPPDRVLKEETGETLDSIKPFSLVRWFGETIALHRRAGAVVPG